MDGGGGGEDQNVASRHLNMLQMPRRQHRIDVHRQAHALPVRHREGIARSRPRARPEHSLVRSWNEAEAAVLRACVAELVGDVDERAEQPTVCPCPTTNHVRITC